MTSRNTHSAFTMTRFTVFCTMIVVVLLAQQVYAQSPVTFQVYVEPELLGEDTEVVVLGGHAALDTWNPNEGLILIPTAEDSNIYQGTAVFEASQDAIEYKYVLRSGGLNTWERDKLGNRRFWPEGQSQTLPLALFDEHASPGIRQTLLTLKVELDLSGFYLDRDEIEGIALMGGRSPLSFDITDPTLMTVSRGRGNVWSAQVSFPYGTAKDIPFKFAWKTDGVWEWEWRPGHTTHVVWLDDTQSQQTIRLAYNPETRMIEPRPASSVAVDNWAAVLEQQGKWAAHSKYNYEYAMELLEAGNTAAAETRYANFHIRYASGNETDDFYYRQARHLYNQGKPEQALTLLETQHLQERDPYRKAYYRYRQGELMLLGGDHKGARQKLQEVEQAYPEHPRIVEYARSGRAFSLTADPTDSTAMQQGIALLEAMNGEHINGQSDLQFISRRGVQHQLARAYEQTGNTPRQKGVMQQLARSGTPRQQAQAQMQLARLEAADNKNRGLSILESVNEAALPERERQRWQVQYTELLWETGHAEAAIEQAEVFRGKWPGNAHLKRLEYVEGKAREQLEQRNRRRNPAPADTTRITNKGGNNQ